MNFKSKLGSLTLGAILTGVFLISNAAAGRAPPPITPARPGNFWLHSEILSRRESSLGTTDLASYVGKYPSELFKREPALKTKLRTLLGANYKAFFDRMQTEMPIEKDDNFIVARGCMAHQCTIEEGIMVVNLADAKPYVAIKFNSRFKTFTGGAHVPAPLTRAMEQ